MGCWRDFRRDSDYHKEGLFHCILGRGFLRIMECGSLVGTDQVHHGERNSGVLIKVSAKSTLLDYVILAIPFPNRTGHAMEKLMWNMSDNPLGVAYNDGFVEVTCKKGKQSSKPKHIEGVRLTKPKPSFIYHPIIRPANGNGEASTSQLNTNKVATDPLPDRTVTDELASFILDSDSEEVEEVFFEKDLSIEPMYGVFDDAHKKVDVPMCVRDVDVIDGLLRARNELEEDLEDHILMLRDKEQMVKKLRKYLVVTCVLVFVVFKYFLGVCG
nr:zinc finger, GRF-type [Tanacetum cinerariifolium]